MSTKSVDVQQSIGMTKTCKQWQSSNDKINNSSSLLFVMSSPADAPTARSSGVQVHHKIN